MAADIEWHTGTIRFGDNYSSYRNRDQWDGCLSLIADLYDPMLCHLYAISGKVSISSHRSILRLCQSLGYERMRETHNGQKLETDLLARPFRRKIIGGV